MPLSTILIIDDDAEDIEMFCEALTDLSSDIQCKSVLNGMEALKVLDSGAVEPELIFLDLNMPGLSGKQCLQKIKQTEAHAKIPVYIYSTSSATSDKEDAEKLGSEGFIIKPSSYSDLKSCLSKILSKYHAL